MLSNVGVVCFLASYFVSFCLEIARFRAIRSRNSTGLSGTPTRAALQIGAFAFAAVGAVAHGAFLYYNDLFQNDRFFADASGWFFLLAFCVVVAQLYLSAVCSKAQFGPFLFPVVFVLAAIGIGVGDATFAPEATCRWTRAAHGLALLLAAALTFVGAVAGAMYFLQRFRLKSKLFAFDRPLPSLEWLGRTTRFSANAALIFFGIGVASGYYLKIFAVEADAPILVGDPVAMAATILFLAVVFRRIVRAKTGADDAADAAILSFVCAAVFAVLLVFIAFSKRGHWKNLTAPELSAPVAAPVFQFPGAAVSTIKPEESRQ